MSLHTLIYVYIHTAAYSVVSFEGRKRPTLLFHLPVSITGIDSSATAEPIRKPH